MVDLLVGGFQEYSEDSGLRLRIREEGSEFCAQLLKRDHLFIRWTLNPLVEKWDLRPQIPHVEHPGYILVNLTLETSVQAQ